ncbi:hypothetical protein THAOC_19977, partial [Thalassiosira oceanica]
VLNFGGNGLSGIGEVAAALATNTQLEELWIHDNKLNDRDAELIAQALKQNTNLQGLDLDGYNVTPNNFIHGFEKIRTAIYDPSSLNAMESCNHTCWVDCVEENDPNYVGGNEDGMTPEQRRRRKLYELLSARHEEGSNARHLNTELGEGAFTTRLVPRVLGCIEQWSVDRSTGTPPPLSLYFELMKSWKMPELLEHGKLRRVSPLLRSRTRVRHPTSSIRAVLRTRRTPARHSPRRSKANAAGSLFDDLRREEAPPSTGGCRTRRLRAGDACAADAPPRPASEGPVSDSSAAPVPKTTPHNALPGPRGPAFDARATNSPRRADGLGGHSPRPDESADRESKRPPKTRKPPSQDLWAPTKLQLASPENKEQGPGQTTDVTDDSQGRLGAVLGRRFIRIHSKGKMDDDLSDAKWRRVRAPDPRGGVTTRTLDDIHSVLEEHARQIETLVAANKVLEGRNAALEEKCKALDRKSESLERACLLKRDVDWTYSAPDVPRSHWIEQGHDEEYAANVEGCLERIKGDVGDIRDGDEYYYCGCLGYEDQLAIMHDDALLPHFKELTDAIQLSNRIGQIDIDNMEMCPSALRILFSRANWRG